MGWKFKLTQIDSASATEETRFWDSSTEQGSYPGLWGGQGAAQGVTDREITQVLTWPAAWLDNCEIFREGAHVRLQKRRSVGLMHLPVGRFAVQDVTCSPADHILGRSH